MRANVFRYSPNNGHRQDISACPVRAKSRHRTDPFNRPITLEEEWNSMQIPFRLGHAMEWYKFIVSFALRLRAPRIGTAS